MRRVGEQWKIDRVRAGQIRVRIEENKGQKIEGLEEMPPFVCRMVDRKKWREKYQDYI